MTPKSVTVSPESEAKEAIDSYITDLLALEEHIAKAVHAQVGDFQAEYPEFAGTLRDAASSIERHIGELKSLTTARSLDAGSTVSEVLKRAGSMVAGLGAAAIDLVRTEKLPKDLRDDYTAFSLATVGYEMLYTTALALDDADVAYLARTHCADYAEILMKFNAAIPAAVLIFLRQKGLPVRENVRGDIQKNIHKIWAELTPPAMSLAGGAYPPTVM